MTSIVLEGPIAEAREREVRLLHDAAELVGQIGGETSAEDKRRLQQNAADLQEMFFLVVVVGEFNAGKSTFINALLGDTLLPMGITPTTDAIELVRCRTGVAVSRAGARKGSSASGRTRTPAGRVW